MQKTNPIRPEINNKVVENHANEVVQFTSGYFMGEPCTYVRRGLNQNTSEQISVLNDYMFAEDKSSVDKEISVWMAVCGVGYRMILPDPVAIDEPDECPFEIESPDPRSTFVVYSSGVMKKELLGVRVVNVLDENRENHVRYCCYSQNRYFEIEENEIIKEEPHILSGIPIIEYNLNLMKMGAFEPAISQFDLLNAIASNRIDAIQQFVQAFIKFINCDIDLEEYEKFKAQGAIKIKSMDGLPADVKIESQELNQSQVQMFVEYTYARAMDICGMPSTTKGGTSTSDTGEAVYLRDGWSQCETRAQDTEKLFKKAEKKFLKIALKIIEDSRPLTLKLADIDCKFTRRQHGNLLAKAQALTSLLQSGISPEICIATCGLFNDPMDVSQRSSEYLEKWKPVQNSALDFSEGEVTQNGASQNDREVTKTQEDQQ